MALLNRRFIYPLLLFLVMGTLNGCFVLKKLSNRKKAQAPPPVMFVIPFSCDNEKVGTEITKAFVENVSKKIHVLDESEFSIYLSSITRRANDIAANKKKYVSEESELSSLFNQEEETVEIHYSSATFFKELVRSETKRSWLYRYGNMHYVVYGTAVEKDLGELEFGNLETAETARALVLELKSGKIIIEENFKQGLFEIVAPNRIGKRFAKSFNIKKNQIRKGIRTVQKERKKLIKDNPYE